MNSKPDWMSFKNVVILSGAGISAASGLRTYRGPDGLWNDPDTAKLSTKETFTAEPKASWQFWGAMRKRALEVTPNDAHRALAAWESQSPADRKFTLITQNIDGLHQRAGSRNVVELHGSIFRTRCSNENCMTEAYADEETYIETVPSCQTCSSWLRPDIVLFGEPLPAKAEWEVKKSLRNCDLFIAVGTSGTVSPASRFVEWAKYAEARTLLVNLEPSTPRNLAFDREIIGPAEKTLPALLAADPPFNR